MAGLGDDRSMDYAGPPPDPPPAGPELADPPDYEQLPPRLADWAEKQDDGDATTSQKKGDGDSATTIQEKDGTSQEICEASHQARGDRRHLENDTSVGDSWEFYDLASREREEMERSEEAGRPDSGARSEAPSGAIPLLRDDTSGVFRRMAEMEELEGRLPVMQATRGQHVHVQHCRLFTWFWRGRQDSQVLNTNANTPSGSGESVTALGQATRHWKRLLGLTVPGGWSEGEYYMPGDPPGTERQPPMLWKILTAAWVLAGVVMVFASIGLQWAYCEREYYGRLQTWPEATSNTTSREYLCVPSFVWACLVPRLLFVFGYVSIFVCIFCLRLPEFEIVIARAYDVITEQRQNSFTTSYFIDYCRRDPRVLLFWFVVIHALSLVGSLLGEDIVRWDLTEAKPQPSSALEWATYVTTCLVRLMMDSMICHCIVSYSLSIKYLELMVERTTWYLQTLVTIRSNISACQYFFTHIRTVAFCVRGSQLTLDSVLLQPATSAALLLAMLRICQVASLVWVDQTSEPRRQSSLAQLPIAIVLFFMVLHHIRRCISLTETWLEVFEKEPRFMMPPLLPPRDEPPRPDPLNIHQFSAEEEKNRAMVLWFQIIRQCPQVSGRVLGLSAGHWMYWAVLVVGTLYCVGYYALLKHAALI